MFFRQDSRSHFPRISEDSATSVLSKIIRNLTKLCLVGAILLLLYQKGLLDFSKTTAVLTNPKIILLGLSCTLFAAVLSVYRWRLLLAGQGISIPFFKAFQLTFIGMFFNTALPGAVSGDVVKAYYIVKLQPDKKGKSKAFATLLFDRILGVSALITLAFLSMTMNMKLLESTPTLKTLQGMVSVLFLGMTVFYGLVLVKWRFIDKLNAFIKKLPFGEIISKVFEAIKCYESNRTLILKGFLTSICIHITIIMFIAALAQALGGFEAVPISNFFLLAPLGLLVTAVPVAPAGLGTGHAAFFALFQLLNVRGGADLFTAFVAFQLVVNLSGVFFYLKDQKARIN